MPIATIVYDSRVKHTIISVGVAAVKLPTTPLAFRKSVFIQNLSTSVIYLGESDISTTGERRGIVLPSQYDNVTLDIGDGVDLYWIVASGTADVVIVETK